MLRARPFHLLALASFLAPSLPAHAAEVAVKEEQIAELEIALSPVKQATSDAVAVLPGTVVPAPNSRIAAAAPFAGTVLKVDALPGQLVKKGDPLVSVMSRDLLEAQGALGQAEAELQMAAAAARRKRDLAAKNILSVTLAEEAEAQVRKLEAVIASHRRSLSLGAMTAGTAGAYSIVAPADGRVVTAPAQPGAPIEAMAAAVMIASSDALNVEAQLPVDLVTEVRIGDAVTIGDELEGTVLSIGGVVDPITRSAALLVSVPAGSPLISGQLVSITLKRPAVTGSFEVPATAVAYINDGHAVFVRSSAGFSLTPVTVTGKSRTSATVSGALSLDQKIAASGLPQLEAMLSGQE